MKQRAERELILSYLNLSLKERGIVSQQEYNKIMKCIKKEYGR